MTSAEVHGLVQNHISSFSYVVPEGTIGLPWSHLVVFDPESREFGLAVANGRDRETVNVWGDLVSAFIAR